MLPIHTLDNIFQFHATHLTIQDKYLSPQTLQCLFESKKKPMSKLLSTIAINMLNVVPTNLQAPGNVGIMWYGRAYRLNKVEPLITTLTPIEERTL